MGNACTKSDRGGTGDDMEPGHRSEANSVISAIPSAPGEKVNSTQSNSRYQSIESQGLSQTSESSALQIFGDRVTVDDFSLLKVVGRGSFGKVYMAKKKDDGQIYAMKTLKKDFMIRNNQ